jgi:hypothetical protein
MSLELAAKHLAAHGRGKDTELIHMDKGEIASLQQIAKANGGSLTINPHTGLPEAGFLSAMLPMIAGAGLMAISGGAINPLTAGLLVGGLRTAQSGDLKKGIMAGFGAYGGAGLASSFGAAGAGSTTTLDGSAIANPPPTPVAPTSVAPDPSAVQNVSGSSLSQVSPISESSVVGQPIGNGPMTNYTDPYETAGYGGSGRPPGFETTPDVTGRPLSDPMYSDGATKGIPTQTYEVAPKSFANMTPSERISAMGRGASFENAYDYAAANPKSSLVAATGVAMGMKKDPVKVEPDKDMGQRYSFTGGKYEPAPAPDVPTYDQMMYGGGNFGRQQKYFKQPTYTPISADEAKSMYHFAAGGPVEMMSNNAAIGANTMYPMANMTTSAFATPYQDPRATNMMSAMAPSGGGTVDAMSGEPNMQGTRLAGGGMAGGGTPAGYTYDAQTRQYMPVGDGGGNTTGAGIYGNIDEQIANAVKNNGIPGVGASGYTYDPQSQKYVPQNSAPEQMASGGIPRYGIGGDLNIQDAPDDQHVGPIGRLLGMTRKREQDANPGLKYAYNPDDQQYVQQQATGGLSDAHYNLGGYSDGGRLLRGPGDGVSDSIPAVIGKKQPARLADGEFVVPARIVSELGNGSTEAGARKLYAMLDRVQAARKHTVGKGKVAKNNRADKYLPA